MRVILLGPPGAGKGSAAAAISNAFGIKHLSTGDILRNAVLKETELGLSVKKYMDAGELVPSNMLEDMVRDCLLAAQDFLLDGYPRTIGQANFLSSLKDLPIDAVVQINVPEKILLRRLTGRRSCKDNNHILNVFTDSRLDESSAECPECGSELIHRSDDTVETVAKRIAIYQNSTQPLIIYYKNARVLIEVDGDRPPDEVSADIVKLLEEIRP